MVRTAFITLMVPFSLLAAACGSSGEATNATPGAASPTTTPAQVGGLGDAVEVAVGGLDDASVAACDINRQTLETAAEAYLALNGAFPTSQDELVTGGWIKEIAPGFEFAPDGTLTPLAGGTCIGR